MRPDQRALAERYIDMADALAHKHAFRFGIPKDDAMSIAREALVGCAVRFDPAENVGFSNYAYTRIVGALRDEMRRSMGNRAPVVRYRALLKLRDRLAQELGRTPSWAEVTERSELGAAEVRDCLMDREAHWGYAFPARLDEPVNDDTDLTVADGIADPSATIADERQALEEDASELWELVDELSPRQRTVVEMSFLEERTLRDIGEALGVTESRVCQIMKRSLEVLRRLAQERDYGSRAA